MRKIINFNDNWTFIDHSSKKVAIHIPHTWNALDGQDGGNDYYRGKGIYEKTFAAPEYNKEIEEVYLDFLGVNASAEVFLNNRSVTVHHGGYSTFRVNVTEHLAENNKLRLEVDNSINDKIYPQKADFTFYGGIYRDVNIVIVNKKHFEMEAYGTPGIKVTSRIDGSNARVEVETDTKVQGAQVKITLMDKAGCIIASGVSENLKQVLTIKDVHLWHGVEDPYLYIATAELIVNKVVTDKISTKFGVRSFHVDPNHGFFLNAKHFPLHGVSRHQDFKGIGNAISKEHHKADMELIREIGANTIRLAHYQHDQYFYDLCDEYGMIVWAEIPYISEHMPNGRENTIEQMKELITQNYNHPSIVTWGISNEITISTKNKKDMLNNHHILNDLCHEMDPTRLTTLACYAMCNPFSKVVHITDIVSYNLYLGWYVPGLLLNDLFLKGFHFFYPNRCIGYAEYGAEGMPNLHSEKPRRGDHSEEYQAIYHEYMIKCFERHPFMWATQLWNTFDFAADARDQGGEPGMNHKGLVTFDRKVKKDSFYLYKAYWNSEPMVHICSKRFVERNMNKIIVKVYSNEPKVSLYQNGKLVETKRCDKIFEFQITLEKDNLLEAVAGDIKDSAYFKKVTAPTNIYKLTKTRTKSSNWV
jgi:beta-galactosidase